MSVAYLMVHSTLPRLLPRHSLLRALLYGSTLPHGLDDPRRPLSICPIPRRLWWRRRVEQLLDGIEERAWNHDQLRMVRHQCNGALRGTDVARRYSSRTLKNPPSASTFIIASLSALPASGHGVFEIKMTSTSRDVGTANHMIRTGPFINRYMSPSGAWSAYSFLKGCVLIRRRIGSGLVSISLIVAS